MKVETIINLFNKIRSIDSEFTESGEIELDNLDFAKLVYDEETDSILVENEHGTRFDLNELSDTELGIFEFELRNELDSNNISYHDAIKSINLSIEDIEMLIDGSWNPDEESANCTLENLLKVRDYLIAIGE